VEDFAAVSADVDADVDVDVDAEDVVVMTRRSGSLSPSSVVW
jgi:hypothetical protein